MNHIIPGLLARTEDPRESLDPFKPGGPAHRRVLGFTHEDMSDPRGVVLMENIFATIRGLDKPFVFFEPMSYPRHAREHWQGGPVFGHYRPIVSYLVPGDGATGQGSQGELDWRYALGNPGGKEVWREANDRAWALLREHLNPQQLLTWFRFNHFYVRGELNELYRVNFGNGCSIVDPYTHDDLVMLCYHPEGFMPHEDIALAIKLLIDTGIEGEKELLETARPWPKITRRHTPDAVGRDLVAMERELLA